MDWREQKVLSSSCVQQNDVGIDRTITFIWNEIGRTDIPWQTADYEVKQWSPDDSGVVTALCYGSDIIR